MWGPIIVYKNRTYLSQPGVVRIECLATKFSLFQDYECIYLDVEEFEFSLEDLTCPSLDVMGDF